MHFWEILEIICSLLVPQVQCFFFNFGQCLGKHDKNYRVAQHHFGSGATPREILDPPIGVIK